MLQGGKFGHGFASAGLTQAFSGAIDGIDEGTPFSSKRILAAAAVGGTASKATGGKFANGALTGAFSRAFNDENDYSSRRQRALDFYKKVKAALDMLGDPYNTPAAAKLLLGTAIAETGLNKGSRMQTTGGLARGLLQMELDTAQSLVDHFLKYNPRERGIVEGVMVDPPSNFDGTRLEYNLTYNDTFGIMMARFRYWVVPYALPQGDIIGYGQYWKHYYNTSEGRGTVRHFAKEWYYTMGGDIR